jgi:hypothetical protein
MTDDPPVVPPVLDDPPVPLPPRPPVAPPLPPLPPAPPGFSDEELQAEEKMKTDPARATNERRNDMSTSFLAGFGGEWGGPGRPTS